jgi:hypothetical protein
MKLKTLKRILLDNGLEKMLVNLVREEDEVIVEGYCLPFTEAVKFFKDENEVRIIDNILLEITVWGEEYDMILLLHPERYPERWVVQYIRNIIPSWVRYTHGYWELK